jgi:hypothetical protein
LNPPLYRGDLLAEYKEKIIKKTTMMTNATKAVILLLALVNVAMSIYSAFIFCSSRNQNAWSTVRSSLSQEAMMYGTYINGSVDNGFICLIILNFQHPI